MFGRKSPAVLVAGAGPVGLFAALCLARHGIHVEIIDEAEEVDKTGGHVPPDDVVILSPGSLALLDYAQLATELLEGCQQVSSVGLYDEEHDDERPLHRSQQRRCVV